MTDTTENIPNELPDPTRLARNGKVARLPKPIRQQLNLKLQDHVPTKDLVEWLNQLPEVKTVLATEFDNRPIRIQNLYEWRNGGYRDWLNQQESLAMMERMTSDAEELQQSAQGSAVDKLATWLTARYVVAARSITDENGSIDWDRLREFTRDVVALRRGDVWSQRMQLEREKFAVSQKQADKDEQRVFWEWAMRPENRDKICKGYRTQGERVEVAGAVIFGDLWSTTDEEKKADQLKIAKQALEAYEVGLAAGKAYLIQNQLPLPQSLPPFDLEAMLQQINARVEAEIEAARAAAGVVVPEDPYKISNLKGQKANPFDEAPSTNFQAPVETPTSKHQTPKNPPPANLSNLKSQIANPPTAANPPASPISNLPISNLKPTGSGPELKTENLKLGTGDAPKPDSQTPGKTGSFRVIRSDSESQANPEKGKQPKKGQSGQSNGSTGQKGG